jgi:methylglutaconyl-CoA hydratase
LAASVTASRSVPKVMPYQNLLVAYTEKLATVTLNRPEKRNALSPETIEELLAALDEIEQSPARVALLTGAGKAFCAGMDLEALKSLAEQARENLQLNTGVRESGAGHPSDSSRADSRRIARMFRRLYDFPKPLIAAVNGAAIAGGCGIATLCDFTLAAAEAQFGYSEVKIGFIPAIVSVFLIRQIGEKRAQDLLLTGRLVSAQEALQIGLINEVVPAEHLMDRAHELAQQLLAASPTSLLYTKRLLRRFAREELDRQLELAMEENARIRSTHDFREGLSAFLEKRRPIWRGE